MAKTAKTASKGMLLDQAIKTLEAEPTSVERKAILAVAREVKALQGASSGTSSRAGAGKGTA